MAVRAPVRKARSVGMPWIEVLRLVVDEEVDVAEADAQQAAEHVLGHRDEVLGLDLHAALQLRPSTA